jgi:hypothetical protein
MLLREARAELVELREAAVWVRLYPDEAMTHSLFTAPVCRGLAEPVCRFLGTRAQLPFERILDLLEGDTQILTTLIPNGIQEKFGRSNERKAVWAETPEGRATEEGREAAGPRAVPRRVGRGTARLWAAQSGGVLDVLSGVPLRRLRGLCPPSPDGRRSCANAHRPAAKPESKPRKCGGHIPG